MIIEFLPMSMAEDLHRLIFTGLLHQTDTGEAETGEEVMVLHEDLGDLNQVVEGLLHLGAPHTVGHPGPGVVDLELQVVTGAGIELLLKYVKSEEINKGIVPHSLLITCLPLMVIELATSKVENVLTRPLSMPRRYNKLGIGTISWWQD